MKAVKSTMEIVSGVMGAHHLMDEQYLYTRRLAEVATLRATMAKAAEGMATIAAAAAEGNEASYCRVVEGVAVHTSRAVADLVDGLWLEAQLSAVLAELKAGLEPFRHVAAMLTDLTDTGNNT